ncbi:MAG: hypothetical protein RIU67_1067 [Actinomycetota bacterium]
MLPSAHRLVRTASISVAIFALAACGGSSDDSTSSAAPDTSAVETTSAPTTAAPTTTAAPAGASVEILEGTSFAAANGPVDITVVGQGFTDLAVGNRPPLDGLPTGVYVVFGWFDENWKPSAGVGTDARRFVFETQSWAMPDESRAVLDPTNQLENVYTLSPEGDFTVTIPIDCSLAGEGTMAIAVYPASGAIQADHEFLLPVTCTA